MYAYNSTAVEPVLSVDKIAILKYIRYASTGGFGTDVHDFWELLYVDKGEACLRIGGEEYILHAGETILYAPGVPHTSVGDWHGVCAGFVSFSCDAPLLRMLENRCIAPDAACRHLLADLFAEGEQYMEGIPKNSGFSGQRLRRDAADYALQMVRNQVELLLLRMYAQREKQAGKVRRANMENFDMDMGRCIISYVREHIREAVSVETAAAGLGISVSKLKAVCREQLGCGFGTYFAMQRLEKAKELIRGDSMTFTEIAAHLGYSSVHYFSRAFKRETGMTPSEYSRSVGV